VAPVVINSTTDCASNWSFGPTAASVSEVRIEEDAAALADPPKGFTIR